MQRFLAVRRAAGDLARRAGDGRPSIARRMTRLRLLAAASRSRSPCGSFVPVLSDGAADRRPGSSARSARSQEKKGQERVLTTTISGYTQRIGALQGDIDTLQARQVRIETDLAAKRAGARAKLQDELRRERIRLDPAARAARRGARGAQRPARRALQGRQAGRRHGDPRVRRLRRPARARGVHAARLRTRTRASSTASATAKAGVGRRREAARRARGAAAQGHRRGRAARRARSRAIKDGLVEPPATSCRRCARTSDQTLVSRRADRHDLEGDLAALEKEQAKIARAAPAGAGRPARRPDPAGLGPLHLAGQRPGRLRRSACAGAGCTPASTSPSRPAPRSAPPTPARVVLLGWTGGYGNYTCIDHGGGALHLLRAPVALSRPRWARASARAR